MMQLITIIMLVRHIMEINAIPTSIDLIRAIALRKISAHLLNLIKLTKQLQ